MADYRNAVKPFVRLNWLDWMKAIGIGLIVYGHFFSLYNVYVYVFSVPLFFFISGFLCKKEPDDKVFWRKLWYNLVIPMLIICTINYFIGAIKGCFLFSHPMLPANPLLFYGRLLIGIHASLGTFWFVYTLIILKIIFQYIKRSSIHVGLLTLFFIFAYAINNYNFDSNATFFKVPWSIPNTFVSYPFFMIGYYLKAWKGKIVNYNCDKYTFVWFILSLLAVFLCGHNHKRVALYVCGYGDNMLLFVVGGICGTALVFFVSKILDRFQWGCITTISTGTMLILGFHCHLIEMYRHFVPQISIVDTVFSVFIVLIFVPIICLCELYIPIIMGKYRVRKD